MGPGGKEGAVPTVGGVLGTGASGRAGAGAGALGPVAAAQVAKLEKAAA